MKEFVVKFPKHAKYPDVYNWCENNYQGKYRIMNNVGHPSWKHGTTESMSIHFKNSEDAMLFLLKWL